jgi:hypothetical protein
MRALLVCVVLASLALAAFFSLRADHAADAGVVQDGVAFSQADDPNETAVRSPSDVEEPRQLAREVDTNPEATPERAEAQAAVVRGRANASRDGGIEGARILVQYRDENGTEDLGEVRTNPRGEYSLEVAGLVTRLAAERSASVWVRVLADGYGTQEQEAHESPRNRGHFEAIVRLDLGWTLHGRVLDATHAPVRAAMVELTLAAFTDDDRMSHHSRPACLTDSAGRYWIGFTPEPMLEYRMLDVSAHAAEVGWAIAPLGEQIFERSRELTDIVLIRSGLAGGRVHYPDGEPVSGFTLTASRSDAESPQSAGGLDRDRRWQSSAAIQDDGRFAFVDLCPGSYSFEVIPTGMYRNFVDTPFPVELVQRDDPPNTTYVPTGTLEFTLDLRRIEVRVLGANGQPAPSFGVSCFPGLFLGRAISSPGFFGPGFAEVGAPVIFRAKPGTDLAVIAWDRTRHKDKSVPSDSLATEQFKVPDFPLTTTLQLMLPPE